MYLISISRIDEYKPLIQKHLKKGWTLERLSLMEKAILYVSIYELNDYSKEIVVNQAVELAKKYCDEDTYKFINGVLASLLTKKYLTVSALNNYLKRKVDIDSQLQIIYIKGEISNLKRNINSGHLYFTLKDEKSNISAIMYKGFAKQLTLI